MTIKEIATDEETVIAQEDIIGASFMNNGVVIKTATNSYKVPTEFVWV